MKNPPRDDAEAQDMEAAVRHVQDVIDVARRRAGLSIRGLARAAGFKSYASVNHILGGHGNPNVRTVEKLLRACGCHLQAAARRNA